MSGKIKSILGPILVFLVVAVAAVGLDRLLYRDGISRRYLLDIAHFLTASFAAGLFYFLSRVHVRRQQLAEEKLRIIADMNHHIRNALQVIAFYAARREDEKEVAVIREAVNRIEWSLREVLPGYPGAQPSQLVEETTARPRGAVQ